MECNLDLRLWPAETPRDCLNPEQLTIFYNGRICVCDVTEIQARAIIWQASKQVEQGRYHHDNSPAISSELPISPASTTSSSSSGLSMKKSLQSFLQKRKRRQLATSPYSGNVRP